MDQVEDEELREFCQRTYGPALDTFAERNFGISPSDDYEDTDEDKELRAFCWRMYGPSLDKFVERNIGLSRSWQPSCLQGGFIEKKAQTAAATLKSMST